MEKDIVCIVCPRGCSIKAIIDGENVTVSGNMCKRGEGYAKDECINPVRVITALVRVANRTDTMVSVKTDKGIPKDKIKEVMEYIGSLKVNAPVYAGDVIGNEIYKAKIIATKNIL